MNKGIKFTPTQIKACEAGATIFLFSLSKQTIMKYKNLTIGEYKKLLPIQKGDKDIFVQEKHTCDNFDMQEEIENKSCKGCYPRYSFSECIDVRVVRVQNKILPDLLELILNPITDIRNDLKNEYNQQLKEQNINRTYEDNDYVLLIEFKR